MTDVHLTIDLAALVVAAILALIWRNWGGVVRLFWSIRAELLRRRLEPDPRRVVALVSSIRREAAEKFCRAVRAAPPGPLLVVIDTNGGDSDAADTCSRALADHQGLVVVVVPLKAWSAGTVVALAADRVVLGPDALLGQVDAIGDDDTTTLWSALEVRAFVEAAPSARYLRAKAMHDASIERCIRDRLLRGDDSETARARAMAVAGGTWGTHWRPIFLEDAKAMGLPVAGLEESPVGRSVMATATKMVLAARRADPAGGS